MGKRTYSLRIVLILVSWCLLSTMTVDAQDASSGAAVTLTGTVLDKSSEPLPGASVLVKGTANGVATDVDGKFTIRLKPTSSTVIVFSFVGMKPKEIPYSSLHDGIKITLEDDSNSLDNVVVTGYANIRKDSFTGTSTTVGREDLMKVSTTDLMKALSAFDPSFKMITDNAQGSNPNNMSEYYIRGRSGVSEVKELDKVTGDVSEFALKNNPSAPVFILDGFEVDQATIYDLDMNRVKSVTTLKDAAATAVYGSRAANGVIVIETVTPEPGAVHLTYSNTTSVEIPDLGSYHLMNAKQALEAEYYAGLFEATADDKNAGGLINYGELYNNVIRGVDTDWIAKPVRTALNHKHYLSVSGGSDALRWSADINYQSKDGVMKGSSRKTYGASMSLDYRYRTLQIRNKASFNVVNASDSPYGSFSDYVRMKPYLSPVDPDTDHYYKVFSIYRNIRSSISEPVYVTNPLYEATLNSFSKSSYREFIDNLSLRWNITPYLMAKGTFSASYKVQDDGTFTDPASGVYTKTDVKEKGQYKDGDIRSSRWTLNGMLSYNRNLKKNNINASLGVEASETKSSSQYSTYLGFVEGAKASPSNALKIKEKPTFSDSNSRRFGTYLQGNWSYDDIYLLDISGRYEGSSAFGAKKKMGLFWSSGAGLNLHNYAFLKNVSWIDRFKVKATYGVTGKANFSPYQARTTYEIMYDNPYIDQWGMALKALGNENLKWEKVNKLNVGAELSFLQNAVTVMFDWYHELTTDQVESVSIPSSSGFTSYKGNLGKVLNQGADVRVNVRAFSNRDWDVYVFTYMNRNTNTIKEIGDALKDYNSSIDSFFKGYSSSSSDSKYSQPFTKYEVGNSLSAIYGMKSLGIDPANGKELYVKRDGTVTYDWSSSEQQCLGDYDPKLSGSFGFNLRWRNWTLYTTMAFRCGGQAYNSTLVSIENVDLEKYNGDVRILTDRWIKPGDNATLKSIKDRTYTTRPTSRFVQDDNEMTMSSLSLGYQFDHNLIKRIGIDALRLQFNAENIFTVSSIRQERGTTYPYARSFNISLNVTL